MSDDQSRPDAAEAVWQKPGEILRQTREAQGFTIAEVASVTKFQPRQIEALERDDYAQLHGKTFLRGFVRVYARMLKLGPEPLLALLEREALPVQELVVPPENMGETDPAPLYRRHFKKVLVLLIVAAAAALVSAWFTGGPFRPHQINPAAVASPPAPVPAAVEPVGEVGATAPATTEPAAEIVSSPSLSAPAVPAAAAMDAFSAVQAPPPQLVFEFSGLSWLEVKDRNGQVLLTGEFPGGQAQTIAKGQAPFQVWIGKSSAVTVMYQGQPVDLQPFTREDVARLALGQ